MKKALLLLIISVFVTGFLLPQSTHAIKVKKFKHYYLGTWENTYDSCGGTGETGNIEIKLTKIKKGGKINSAKVWFNDGRIGDMEARGKIYFTKKKVRKIRLRYTENNWNDDYRIRANITKNSIVGAYEHISSGCTWGGPVNLSRN